MKLLALTVLLAIMQTVPPVPRKTADNPAQTTPAKADSSGAAKADSGEQHPEDAQHTVGISKLPPVSVTRDWADWGIWVFSGLLVVVGFLQVWLLFRTWKTINKQNLLTEFAQQPWVELSKWRTEKSEEGTIECKFEAHNPTSIPITLRKVFTEVTPMRRGSNRRSYEVTENLMLPPHGKYVCCVPIILREEDMADYRASKFFVVFSGTVFILNAEKKEIGQRFQQLAVVAPKKITLYEPAGAIPDECANESYDKDEAN
jgi:hypothetical protein